MTGSLLAQREAMQLFVGEAGLRGSFERYARHHKMIELRARMGTLPRPGKLRAWRATAGPDFVFSLAVDVSGGTGEPDVGYAVKCAEPLGAAWLVLRSGPGLPPSKQGREQLAAIAKKLSGQSWRVAWEPGGLWERDAADEFAEANALHLVVDASKEPAPPSDAVYTRIRALGTGGQLRGSDVERAAEALDGASEVYVIVEGASARKVERTLTAEFDLPTPADPTEPEQS